MDVVKTINSVIVEPRTFSTTIVTRERTIIATAVPQRIITAVAEQGPQGIPGPPGPQGVAGSSSGSKFIFTQSATSVEWIVNHNLGEIPIADVTGTGGQKIDADILHVSINQLRVYFSFPASGQVRCL
ncbi:MAG: hypothetical protein M3367_02880 [Acidobacteriota bacterium]|nr:hypothetical protein [Acidobacteriota bacterium]